MAGTEPTLMQQMEDLVTLAHKRGLPGAAYGVLRPRPHLADMLDLPCHECGPPGIVRLPPNWRGPYPSNGSGSAFGAS